MTVPSDRVAGLAARRIPPDRIDRAAKALVGAFYGSDPWGWKQLPARGEQGMSQDRARKMARAVALGYEADLAARDQRIKELEQEKTEFQKALYECAKASGADLSGNADEPEPWLRERPEWCVEAVQELRKDYDEALVEIRLDRDLEAKNRTLVELYDKAIDDAAELEAENELLREAAKREREG